MTSLNDENIFPSHRDVDINVCLVASVFSDHCRRERHVHTPIINGMEKITINYNLLSKMS